MPLRVSSSLFNLHIFLDPGCIKQLKMLLMAVSMCVFTYFYENTIFTFLTKQ